MTSPQVELLIVGMEELHTMDPARGEGPTGRILDAAVGFTGGRVSYLGPAATAPEAAPATTPEAAPEAATGGDDAKR